MIFSFRKSLQVRRCSKHLYNWLFSPTKTGQCLSLLRLLNTNSVQMFCTHILAHTQCQSLKKKLASARKVQANRHFHLLESKTFVKFKILNPSSCSFCCLERRSATQSPPPPPPFLLLSFCWCCLPRQGYCVQIHYRVQQLKGLLAPRQQQVYFYKRIFER